MGNRPPCCNSKDNEDYITLNFEQKSISSVKQNEKLTKRTITHPIEINDSKINIVFVVKLQSLARGAKARLLYRKANEHRVTTSNLFSKAEALETATNSKFYPY